VPSVLQQLENNDAVLLMYLAGELPDAERTEVERMLAVDAGLRGQLERLREAHAWFAEEMARDDRSTRPAVSQGAAVRRVGRAMRQWHTRRLAEAPAAAAAPRPGLRYPWWAYPLSAAASVVIAFLVWWGNTDRPVPGDRDVAVVAPSAEDVYANADPAAIAGYQGEMIAQSLGFGDYRPDGFGGPGGGDWDESGALYAAVAPTDANVLMLLNNLPEENEAGADDEPI
jgi:hypothetical protein